MSHSTDEEELLVLKITTVRSYVVFDSDDFKVIANANIHGDVLMERKNVLKLYVLYYGESYVDNACQHETDDF